MKQIFFKGIGIGLLMIFIYNIIMFVVSFLFEIEDYSKGPELLPSICFAALMGIVSFGMVLLIKPDSMGDGFIYTILWAIIVFIAVWILTIVNDTTTIFFKEWYSYLSFFSIAITPLFAVYFNNNPDNK